MSKQDLFLLVAASLIVALIMISDAIYRLSL